MTPNIKLVFFFFRKGGGGRGGSVHERDSSTLDKEVGVLPYLPNSIVNKELQA